MTRTCETMRIGEWMLRPAVQNCSPGPSPPSLGEASVSIEWRLCRLVEKLSADQHATDLRGPGADLVELCGPPQPAGGKFVDIAVAAQRLDRLAGHPGRTLGRIEDGAGGILARG